MTTVIVGGGIAGMAAAWIAKRRNSSRDVILLERTSALGGLHTSYSYGDYGLFDSGMHFFSESGVPEIDELFHGLLPEDGWVTLEGKDRDSSGLFFRGHLQTNTQYPDLRRVDEETYRRYLADFFRNFEKEASLQRSDEPATLRDFAHRWFGPMIASEVIGPISEKVHGAPADKLDAMARFLPLQNRVCLFGEEAHLQLMESDALRLRLAYPEQKRLPLDRSSGRKSWYPKEHGIIRVVEALTSRLRQMGVRILLGATVEELNIVDGNVKRLEFACGKESFTVVDVDSLVWTAGPYSLARALGIKPDREFDRPRKTVIVNLLLNQPPRMGDLYCLFCADEPYKTYRVSNFTAYCPSAPRKGGWPISVELFLPFDHGMDQEACQATAVNEIVDFGLISDPGQVIFSRAEELASGFPTITRNNVLGIDYLRERIAELKVRSIVMGGILAERNLFFQGHVLEDIHRKMDAR